MGISPFVRSGALLALSCDNADIGRQAGELAVKILNGARPTDLPITVPEKIRLAINLKTAKRIGLNIPSQIVDKADEVFK
jgi:putative ABC transport system substrate-binding protein